MNMDENANMIEFLQSIGWKDEQIINFFLVIDGRRSITDGTEVHHELEK